MGKGKNKFDFESGNIIGFVLKNFKQLTIISLIAGIVTAVVTLFMDNMFKSDIVMFPMSKTSVPRSIVDIRYGGQEGQLYSVGEDEEVDQMLQMLNSADIRSKLVSKYNLVEHYKIDLKKPGAYSKLYNKLDDNIACKRTEYNSVVVSVWDKDPQIAAQMANTIGELLDSSYRDMIREKAKKVHAIIKIEYDSLFNHINKIRDSLAVFYKMGLIDFNTQFQVQQIVKAYYKALSKGQTELARTIKKQINIIEQHGATYQTLILELKVKEETLGEIGNKLTEAKVALTQNLPNKFIVNKAAPADMKDYPKRSIIVLVAMFSAFFLTLFSLIIMNNIKKII